MKRINNLFLLSALLLLTTLGCKKTTLEASNATVVYSGPIAADGCDWVIVVNSVYYHPDNLDDKYKVNNAKVNVSYKLLANKFQCGTIPISATNPGMSMIHITNITFISSQ